MNTPAFYKDSQIKCATKIVALCCSAVKIITNKNIWKRAFTTRVKFMFLKFFLKIMLLEAGFMNQ